MKMVWLEKRMEKLNWGLFYLKVYNHQHRLVKDKIKFRF